MRFVIKGVFILTTNTRELNRSEVTINQVEEYLNHLQYHQGEKVEPNVSKDSKQCAIAMSQEFKGFDGLSYASAMYFYEGSDYAVAIPIIFDDIGECFYLLVKDIVERAHQPDLALFIKKLISESLSKSQRVYSPETVDKLNNYIATASSMVNLKDLINGNIVNDTKLTTDLKAELINAIWKEANGGYLF